jgi:FtsP/CotA-like multicopper oxidase with cupredoxin domain
MTRHDGKRPNGRWAQRWLVAAVAAAFVLLHALPVQAQTPGSGQGQGQQGKRQKRTLAVQPSQFITCAQSGQPLLQIPELVSQGGVLRGTVVLQDSPLRMDLGLNDDQCVPQFVRNFQGLNTVPAAYGGIPPAPAPPVTQYGDPSPGPTLRAQLGDKVQLTFLNQINPGDFGDSIDRGERGQGCDESTAPYPGLDTFPDCFHGSSTGNIHFHGTHTSPSTTGDDVFIEVRPSPRAGGQPTVTPAYVQAPFEKFFAECTAQLNKSVLAQWPKGWSDFPPQLVAQQLELLALYDADPSIKNKLLPVDLKQWASGSWPQYYIGAFPYCFQLPEYKEKVWPPAGLAHPVSHGADADAPPPLQMGQSPGTHWYHAHKHGSTTVNVANGMTGAFIIEGASYDGTLNQFYSAGWTGQQPWARSQPVLIINQLGVSPNLLGGGSPGGPLPFQVNGRFQPVIAMQPGQVQLWRIANTASRGAVFMSGFAPKTTPATSVPSSPQVFAWKQIAQDGVQFNDVNYGGSQNPQLVLAAGNRADILVQAPTTAGLYVLLAQQVRSRCATLPPNLIPTIPTVPPNPAPNPTPICAPDDLTPLPLLIVNVTGTPATGNQALFIPAIQMKYAFPPFLQDIKDSEVTGTKTVVFQSTPTNGNPGAMHTVNGHKFDGNVGEVIMLNTVEEWKIVNSTVNGGIQPAAPPATPNPSVIKTDPPGVVDHPFHIHINPFQVVELFDPNQFVPDPTNNNALIPKYVTTQSAITNKAVQCFLDPADQTTWKDCHNTPLSNGIWWDVFMIPSARAVFANVGTANLSETVIPGYFKMRSRFVDFAGQYVLHCHILAHEDRGMMTVVEVVPFKTAYSHK